MTKKSSKRADRTRFPLPVPIDDGSRICVKLYIPNILEHRAAFQGAVLNLAHWYSWTLDDAKQGREVAAVWEQIYLDMMATFYDGCPDDKPCHDFSPAAGFIEYFPNNPYTEPDLITAGYNSPAWYLATAASNLVLGTEYGDVVTDLSRFPPGSLPTIIPSSGLPRIRLNLVGEGLVRLYMLNLFGGSLIQITVDDNLATLRFLDSDRDLIAIPFETLGVTIAEVTITGSGAHHIDLIVVSQVNDSIPFLHHGGGLRKIELCGFESMVTVPNPIFRFTAECLLQVSYNGIDYDNIPGWSDFAPACFLGADGAPGVPGADGAPGAPGADGVPGAPGLDNNTRCQAATAISRHLANDFLSPMIFAIIQGLNDALDPSAIETLAAERWFQITGGLDCATQFSDYVNDLTNLNVPDGTLENYRSAIADTPLQDDMLRGLFCWLCPDGSLDFTRIGEFTTAVANLYPDDIPRQIFAKWLFMAVQCSPRPFMDMVSAGLLASGCTDCAELSCDDWNVAFTQWVHDFNFNIEQTGWNATPSGSEKTGYVTDHGFQPFAAPAGSGNFACISIASDTTLAAIDRIDIGLESAYGAPGHIKVSTILDSTGLEQVYDADFADTVDYFTLPYSGALLNLIHIEITRTDAGCTSQIGTSLPTIRYVTIHGHGVNPF